MRRASSDQGEVLVVEGSSLVEVLNRGDGGRRPEPVRRALGWSAAVVLLGALPALVIVPSAQGRSAADLAAPGTDRAPDAGAGGRADSGGPASSTPDAAGSAAGSTTTTGPARGPAGSAATGSAGPVGAAGASARKPATAPGPAAKAQAASPSAAPAARLQPDAGSYPLSIRGTSAVDGQAAAVPSSGTLLVQQRSSSDQSQQTVGLPGSLVLVQRATPSGLDLVSFSLTASSRTLTFQPPSALAFVRTDVAAGTSWSWSARSTDGSVSVSQTATVTGIGTVSVAGATVAAVTVDRVLTATGSVQGTIRVNSTVSLVDRLPLVQHQALDVKATALGLFSTHIVSDVTATLTSTRPR